MCWSAQASTLAAVYGCAVCWYLARRQHSKRDMWYAQYLFTFTLTQVVDVLLWWEDSRVPFARGADAKSANGCSTASTANKLISVLIPAVVLLQFYVQCQFPGKRAAGVRSWLLYGQFAGCCTATYLMWTQFECTTVVTGPNGTGEALRWGGVQLTAWQLLLPAGLTLGIFYATMPLIVWLVHLGVFSTVMGLPLPLPLPLPLAALHMHHTEGPLVLSSAWCACCLVFSAVYMTEPYWYDDAAQCQAERNARLLREAFRAIDRNDDGELSRAEVIRSLKHDANTRMLLKLPSHIDDNARKQFEDVFQAMDIDDSRKINFEEFALFVEHNQALQLDRKAVAGSRRRSRSPMLRQISN